MEEDRLSAWWDVPFSFSFSSLFVSFVLSAVGERLSRAVVKMAFAVAVVWLSGFRRLPMR